MADPDPQTRPDPARPNGPSRRFGWLGWALIVTGVFCILFPLVASITAKVLIGWGLLIGGALTLWHAFQSREWGSAILSAIWGIVYLAIGVYLAFFPLTGLIGLTVLLGLVFIAQGVIEGVVALRHRGDRGWIWLTLSAVASAVLGILLIAGLPGTAIWGIGLMLGINLVSSGIAMLAVSRTLRV